LGRSMPFSLVSDSPLHFGATVIFIWPDTTQIIVFNVNSLGNLSVCHQTSLARHKHGRPLEHTLPAVIEALSIQIVTGVMATSAIASVDLDASARIEMATLAKSHNSVTGLRGWSRRDRCCKAGFPCQSEKVLCCLVATIPLEDDQDRVAWTFNLRGRMNQAGIGKGLLWRVSTPSVAWISCH